MRFSRRFVLRGLGATVAIPVLPSLLTAREAKAAPAELRPCFVSFATNHGGAWAQSMFPAAPAQGVVKETYAGRETRRFPLTATRSGGQAAVSPVLTAPDTKLTDALLAKMYTVQGVGVPFYIAHNTGGALGNYARNDANGGDGAAAQTGALRPTIDQLMAWSSAFYPDLSSVRQRAIILSGRSSYNYAQPDTRTGAIQEITGGVTTPNQLFDTLFPSGGGPSARRPIVDQVLEAYRQLRQSPRLSTSDKGRLDEHLQRLDEVQRRLGTSVSCTTVARPTNPSMSRTLGDVMYGQAAALDPAAHAQYEQALNDVIVLALSCGVSRIAVNRIDLNFSAFDGDWHQDVIHKSDQADGVSQGIVSAALQKVFAGVVVDLAAKLDAVDMGSGTTLLDQTMLSWVQECGNQTHDSTTIPVVGFGGAQGFLKTGSHLDYRNLAMPISDNETDKRYPGLVWNQWLGTALQAMRIPKSEWEKPAVNGGYPDYNFQNLSWVNVTAAQAWPPAVWAVSGDVLPWLKA